MSVWVLVGDSQFDSLMAVSVRLFSSFLPSFLGACALLTGEQQVEQQVHLDAFFERPVEPAHGAAHTALLHAPALQHLVHLLAQAVAAVVVVDGVHLHVGQAQAPGAALPVAGDVFPEQFQMVLGDGVVI